MAAAKYTHSVGLTTAAHGALQQQHLRLQAQLGQKLTLADVVLHLIANQK
jgi:hypothetical protein